MNQFKADNKGIPVALFLGNLGQEEVEVDEHGNVIEQKKKQPVNDGLDNEALKKIEDFKKKYQEMQEKANENEKELAYSTIKVDEIVSKVKEVDDKKNEFKEQLNEEAKENQKLRRKLRELEDEKVELEQQLETGMKPTKVSKVKEVNLEKHKKILEEKERKEREEMRKQIIHGVDFVGQKDFFKILQGKNQNGCTRCLRRTYIFFLKLYPLRTDLLDISSQYDKAIHGYFVFFRYLVVHAMLTLVLFSGLLIKHVFDYSYGYSSFCEGVVSVPCIINYSRFNTDIATLYSATLIAFIVFGIISTLYEWVQFDLTKKEQDLYEADKVKFKYSRMLLNSWNW